MKQTIKAGDKVRMLEDISIGKFVEDCYTFHKGKVYTVKLVMGDGLYPTMQVYTEDQEDYWYVHISKFELVEPSDASNIDEQQEDKETLRDKFAMVALTGLLFQYATKYPHEDALKESYQIADAMMKARKK